MPTFNPKEQPRRFGDSGNRAPTFLSPPVLEIRIQGLGNGILLRVGKKSPAETLLSKCRASLFIQISPQCLFKGGVLERELNLAMSIWMAIIAKGFFFNGLLTGYIYNCVLFIGFYTLKAANFCMHMIFT